MGEAERQIGRRRKSRKMGGEGMTKEKMKDEDAVFRSTAIFFS